MLVGFIGSPCSGKTTTAAKVFAELKDSGQPVEYIAERARTYIANKKFSLKAAGIENTFSLTDKDQVNIAASQYRAELVMNQDNLIVVTDSCVLNSLLYMSEAQRSEKETEELMKEAASKYDVLFICATVPRPNVVDPNRVHDEQASIAIHNQIEPVLGKYLKDKNVHILTGTTYARMHKAISEILSKFASV